MTNPLRRDPTHTMTLRRSLFTQLRKRFRKLKAASVEYIQGQHELTEQGALSVEHLTENFGLFLEEQSHIIFQEKDWLGQSWLNFYVRRAYEQAAGRSYSEHKKEAVAPNKSLFLGEKASFVKSLSGTVGVLSNIVSNAKVNPKSRLQLVMAQAQEELKAVVAQFTASMSRSLVEGLKRAENTRRLVNDLRLESDDLFAKKSGTFVNTQIVGAYAEGTLDALEELGVSRVGGEVEFTTSEIEPEKICQACKYLEGVKFTIAEARGVIPVHPNCRCRWVAVV